MNNSFWNRRSVFVTGHTGFKGSWLSLLLTELGAEVHGFSLPAPTAPSLFEEATIGSVIASSTIGDIRDRVVLQRSLHAAKPSIVFHLAAQPMVLSSYKDPFETYDINALGTVSVLEGVRNTDSVDAVVAITTDKCYENREWDRPYHENDTLGGHDPYSNSKACCELLIQSFQKSFYLNESSGKRIVGLASARAGNIFGGGDWGIYRLVPDYFRAYKAGESLKIRHPDAVRPWQHVLEPLHGYLQLAQAVATAPKQFSSGWNFGPDDSLVKTVSEILSALNARAKKQVTVEVATEEAKFHEAKLLRLDCSKARGELGWRPKLTFNESIELTVEWYEKWMEGAPAQTLALQQIAQYRNK